jgi:hypothetical protein
MNACMNVEVCMYQNLNSAIAKNTASGKTMDSYENGVTGTATLFNVRVSLITRKKIIRNSRYKQAL